MNQKTILAVILSIFVLFGYETVFVAPKRAAALKESQLHVSKEDAYKQAIIPTVQSNIVLETTKTDFKVKNTIFKTPFISTDATNKGGSLHNIKIGDHDFPLDQVLAVKGIENSEFRSIAQDNQIVFSYEDPDFRVTKTLKVNDDRTINAKIVVTGLKTMSRLEDIEFILFNINLNKISKEKHRDIMLEEYSISMDKKIIRQGNADKFNTKENKFLLGKIDWAGFRDHYSAVVVKPEFATKTYEIKSVTEKELAISVKPELTKNLENSITYEFSMYVGPQDIGLMKKYKKGWEDIVAFSKFLPLDLMEKAIYYTIPFLHGIFKSWGISIIAISILIYGLTYPLTIKSMLSMRKMQLVQPKIKALQDRYKSDPKKLNTEIMNIYKMEKINPLGGCLPMLLQMPIFIALYQILWRAYYFQGQGFLWIKDLTLPDRLFIFPFSLPFIGNEFNILPLLAAGVMFAQQSIATKNVVATDEQQIMQQKMMKYLMPVFLGFIFYKFASGLSLYLTVFYALSTLTQWKMNKSTVVTATVKR